MARTKLKFRLHRAVIVLFCLALLVALMQGASWFSQNHQRQRNPQLEELARTLARQVTLNVAPLMRTDSPDEKRIQAILDQLTDESRILDAGVYDEQGDLIARSGESVEVRDRLALDGKKAGGYFNQQIVEPIAGKNGPLGYLRLTLDTHTLATEAQQVDNTTNILRLMLLLSLAIGVVLTRTLLQGKRTRWQQSPFLLTASKPVPEEEESEKKSQAPMNYEPEAEESLDLLIPKYINSIIYGAFIEAVASENGARMQAMDAATSNAEEMISTLSLAYNRARQGAITQELTEIISGAEALN